MYDANRIRGLYRIGHSQNDILNNNDLRICYIEEKAASAARHERDAGGLEGRALQYKHWLPQVADKTASAVRKCYLQHSDGCFFAKLFPCFIR